MKILQLCHKPPFPPVDGGCIAMNNVTEALLHKGHEVKILTASTDKHPFKKKNYSKEYIKNTAIEACYINTKVNIVDAFSALVTADNYNISRFFTPDFDKLLKKVLEQNTYDVVHIESLFMTPYIDTIRKLSNAKIILRSHNLEHIIWRRLAENAKNKAKKIYIRHLSNQLKKYEESTLPLMDGIAAMSYEDRQRYQKLKNTPQQLTTIPFGIDLKKYTFQAYEGNGQKYFHLGSMNWHPNIEAVEWFTQMIWPELSKEDEKLHLYLAGNSIDDGQNFFRSDNISNDGRVENAQKYMQEHGIMVAPLLSGGGMRVKIIEAMALGCPVITTSVGIEGIEAEQNEHYYLANDQDEFKKTIRAIRKKPENAIKISHNARQLVEEKYDNNKIIDNLIDFYSK